MNSSGIGLVAILASGIVGQFPPIAPGFAGGEVAPWSVDRLAALWLPDQGVTLINTNEVDEWADVNAGLVLQGYASSRPTFTAWGDSSPCMACAAGQSLDELSPALLDLSKGQAEVWVFAAVELVASDAADRNIFTLSINSSAVSYRIALRVKATTNALQAGGRRTDGESYGSATTDGTEWSAGDGMTHLVAARFSAAANTVEVWLDGVQLVTDDTWTAAAVATFDDTASADLNWGDDNLTMGFTGIHQGTLSDEQRIAIESAAAAAHPYIANSLPVGHPAKA